MVFTVAIAVGNCCLIWPGLGATLWGILDYKFAPAKNTPPFFQLILAQTCKTSCQDVFFFMSRDVPGL